MGQMLVLILPFVSLETHMMILQFDSKSTIYRVLNGYSKCQMYIFRGDKILYQSLSESHPLNSTPEYQRKKHKTLFYAECINMMYSADCLYEIYTNNLIQFIGYNIYFEIGYIYLIV